MEAVIIIVIIIGIIFLIASFMIKDKPEYDQADKEKLADEIRSMTMSEDSMDKIMQEASSRFSDRINGMAEDKLTETSDKMGQAANEKMIAINDMADQLIEKIDENHKEVVFLYDMLNEKSDSIKDYSSRLEGMKHQIDSETKLLQTISQSIDEKAAFVRASQKINEAQTLNNLPDPAVPVINANIDEHDEKKGILTGIEAAAAATRKRGTAKKIAKRHVVPAVDNRVETVSVESLLKPAKTQDEQEELNRRVIEMADNGMSVTDISKQFGIGQGEVNFMIGLYGKRK